MERIRVLIDRLCRTRSEMMGDSDDDRKRISLWVPITNKLDLAHLTKLGEELNEAGAAVFRCIAQGIDECEPDTGKANKVWLEEELADVEACLTLVVKRYGLDIERMAKRINRKIGGYHLWHDMIRAMP